MDWVIYLAIVSFICGAIVGGRRYAAVQGALLGLFCGPVGVLAAFALDGRPKCPWCQERVDVEAVLCPHCRTQVRTVPPPVPQMQ